MRSRALKIAMAYHEESKQAQTENVEPSSLDDTQISQAITDALDTYYPAYIEQWLRNTDVAAVMTSINYIVSQFHQSDSPKQELKSELSSFKTKFLKIIKDIAKSDDNSIKDTAFDYFKKNPTTNTEDVDDYMREFLIGIKNDSRRQVNKWKDAL